MTELRAAIQCQLQPRGREAAKAEKHDHNMCSMSNMVGKLQNHGCKGVLNNFLWGCNVLHVTFLLFVKVVYCQCL